MNTNRRFGAFSSSENPQQLADTVKGVIIALSTAIIFAFHLLGINIVSDQISQFATGFGSAISAIWIAYGLVKKFIVWAVFAWQNRSKE